ncbi:histidine kinase dimerization/phospho-acceptor domain-containing protein [Inquilinus sp.]|jgi:two-component system sensor histidine kinase RpfC|uniref:ATP-binding protein n=1 Tax=Inquilinus sp. TaxID=1932117 RepID=UPI00378343DA
MTETTRQEGSRSLAGRIVQRLQSRPDSEHEMRFNGCFFGTAIGLYLLATTGTGSDADIVPLVYLSLNLAAFGHILWRPGVCRPRRIFSILNDFIAMFWVMHLGDDVASVLFPIYLWVVLGNGFRFGARFLALAAAVGMASFGAVVATTPFWHAHPQLSAGLLGGILLLAVTAAPLIRQLSQAKRQAEAANREASFILAGVGHELRTPLTALLGTGSVLRDTALDPAQQEMARGVVSAGQRLLDLIDGLPGAPRPGAARARPPDGDPAAAAPRGP